MRGRMKVCTEIKSIKDLLEQISNTSNKVFIVGHNEPDFDSIGSAIGLQSLCTALGKEAYIIINDSDITLEPGVKKIKEKSWLENNIINMAAYEIIKDADSSLIVTDTNKLSMTCLKDNIDDFQDIIIVDHHHPTEESVSHVLPYIREKSSSASEIVTQVLTEAKVKCSSDIYTYLLAGIILDTKRFQKNTTSKTHECARILRCKGAEVDYINELFLEDFDTDKRINDLVFNGTEFHLYEPTMFEGHTVSITLNRTKPETIYRKEDIAKAADKMLKYKVDATFALGHVSDTAVSISARSKSGINVGKIMAQLGGGGNSQNAGARIENKELEEIENLLKDNLVHGIPKSGETASSNEETPKQLVKV